MNIKYKGQWRDLTTHNQHEIQILTDDDVVSVENIDIISCEFEYPDNHILSDSCLNGQGGEISFISPSKLYFSDLYTENYLKYRVKHFINNNLIFNGYLDSEQYNDQLKGRNYQISFKCNDGISVLERLKFSNQPLTGVDSAYKVILNCLRKLSIDYESINISLSTTIPNTSISSTLLHTLMVNVANYFDEKGVSMSCREVINAILLPISARLYIYENQVYIIDINSINESVTWKKYDFQRLAYLTTTTDNNLININGLYNGEEGVEMQSGKNQVNLKFSKYCYDNPQTFDNSDLTNYLWTDNYTAPDGAKYKENVYMNCDGFTSHLTNNVKYVNEIDSDDNSNDFIRFSPTLEPTDPMFQFQIYMTGNTVFSLNTGLFLNSSPLAIKIEFDYMVEDILRYKEEYDYDAQTLCSQGPAIGVEIGDFQYSVNGWYAITDKLVFNRLKDQSLTLGNRMTVNKWFKAFMYAPLNNDYLIKTLTTINGGILNLRFNGCLDSGTNKKFCIKNIKISYCEAKSEWNINHPNCIFKSTTLEDSEITGYLNENYKDDLDFEIMHGSDPARVSRGAFLLMVNGAYSDCQYSTNERIVAANEFTRAGQTATIEKLLLNTLISNYESSRFVFNCELKGYYKPFNVFKYPLLAKNNVNVKMIPTSIKVDYVNGFSNFKLLEFVNDNLIIN